MMMLRKMMTMVIMMMKDRSLSVVFRVDSRSVKQQAEWKWQEKRTRNTQVNTGCIANILMSLFLISAKGKMPVINK